MPSIGVSRGQAWTAVAMWLTCSILTLQVTTETLDREEHRDRTIAITTAATILGPMTGAIGRHGESSCLSFSLALLPICLGALSFGIIAQFVVPPTKPLRIALRWVLWCLGFTTWFGGGVLSLAQALS